MVIEIIILFLTHKFQHFTVCCISLVDIYHQMSDTNLQDKYVHFMFKNKTQGIIRDVIFFIP